jgi:1,4-alpha-glucan branching enzyme
MDSLSLHRARHAGSSSAPWTTPTPDDIERLARGDHCRLFRFMGAHAAARGTTFRVWAPNADRVDVIGDFNDWQAGRDALARRDDGSGVFEGFVEGAAVGARYKYRIASQGAATDKADPFAFCGECPPRTASTIWSLDYAWGDRAWMVGRGAANALAAPMAIYEAHLGSWRAGLAGDGTGYRPLAEAIAVHALDLGFSQVELMPVTEHPFYGSWGYQTTGYFSPTARYGTPQDLMAFVDHLHQRGLGVILDWVPGHFPNDVHGLAHFDGTALFEHAHPFQGFHPEWRSHVFNFGRNEVRAFLTSSAMFWLDRYHFDGLRVDGVASMLYLDYARKAGEWIPNAHGGRENLDAVAFLRDLNTAIYREHPDVQTIAEESTAWPQVSRPVDSGGLGFGLKWNMGWMHDTLAYFARDPVHRRHHQGELTFSLIYAFDENFVLPLSHDEVVYGKRSLIDKMPGDLWQQFANLRALYGYMWAHPGKKLLFMGGEIAQRHEWAHGGFLEWDLLRHREHAGLRDWLRDLNGYYRRTPALHEVDFEPAGFAWIDMADAAQSVVAFVRKPRGAAAPLVLACCNFTPVPRTGYRVGVPRAGRWREALNSDATDYGGSGVGNLGGATTRAIAAHGHAQSLELALPPLSVTLFESEGGAQ